MDLDVFIWISMYFMGLYGFSCIWMEFVWIYLGFGFKCVFYGVYMGVVRISTGLHCFLNGFIGFDTGLTWFYVGLIWIYIMDFA